MYNHPKLRRHASAFEEKLLVKSQQLCPTAAGKSVICAVRNRSKLQSVSV